MGIFFDKTNQKMINSTKSSFVDLNDTFEELTYRGAKHAMKSNYIKPKSDSSGVQTPRTEKL